jgi:hypothetical protein
MARNSKAEESADRRTKHPVSKSLLYSDSSSKDRIAQLERELAKMKKREVSAVQYPVCDNCGDLGHKASECSGDMGQATEEVNQVYGERKYDMNSNTYHAGLRNHPNFRYGNPANQMNPNFQSGNQGGGGQYQGRQGGNQGGYQRNNYNQGGNQGYNNNYQRGYNQGGSSSNQGNSSGSQGSDESLSSKLDALMNMMKDSNNDIKEMKKGNEVRDKSHEALAKQVGQLAEEMAQWRGSTGKLPSDTTINPQHQASSSRNNQSVHINAVSFILNDKVVGNETTPPQQFVDGVVEEVDSDDEQEEENISQNNFEVKNYKKSFCEKCLNEMTTKTSVGMETNTIPYPAALVDLNNVSSIYKWSPPKDERWENFKQVKINLPLIDAIEKVPAHIECVKELSNQNKHNKLPEHLGAHVRAVLSDALPPKLQDPRAPLIPIQVGELKIERALLDLGACVSILPGSLFDQYDFGPLHEINTTVVLADQTLTHPRGMVNDVLVKVEDFYYPVDFLVVDYVNSAINT